MDQMNGQTALEIVQDLLSKTGKALIDNDFALFATCFSLPQLVQSADHKTTLHTEQDLRGVFDILVQDLREEQVTEIFRVCDIAMFKDAQTLEATYISHCMSGDQRVIAPYPSFLTITWHDNAWRIQSGQYAVAPSRSVGRALQTVNRPK